MGTYSPTVWEDNTSPYINETNLNNMEAGIAAALRSDNNLDDVDNPETARTNLGLGDAATADFGTGEGDIAEGDHGHTIADISDAGDSAALDVGTTAGTVAAGDDARIVGALQAASDLSDVDDPDVARANLNAQEQTALYLTTAPSNYAACPTGAGLNVTDLEVEWHGSQTDWTPASLRCLIGRFTTSGDQRSWMLTVVSGGIIRLYWSPDGTSGAQLSASSTVAPTVSDGAYLGIKVTLDVDDGAGNRVITFSTSTDLGATWTPLGSTVTAAGTTSVFNATSSLDIGSYDAGSAGNMAGGVKLAVVRNGIGGSAVASPDFRNGRGPRFRDEQGNVWTINGSAWAWAS